jgi:hypothetical protein
MKHKQLQTHETVGVSRRRIMLHSQQQMRNALEHKRLEPPGGCYSTGASALQRCTQPRRMRPYPVVHSQQQMRNALEHKQLGAPGGP